MSPDDGEPRVGCAFPGSRNFNSFSGERARQQDDITEQRWHASGVRSRRPLSSQSRAVSPAAYEFKNVVARGPDRLDLPDADVPLAPAIGATPQYARAVPRKILLAGEVARCTGLEAQRCRTPASR